MKMLKIYTDFIEDIAELTDAEKGRLFVMMLTYAGSGEEIPSKGRERYLWNTAKKMINAQRESYEGIVNRNRTNGLKHTGKTQENPNEPKRTQWDEEQEQEQEQEYKKKTYKRKKPNRVIDGYAQSPIGSVEHLVVLKGDETDE